MDQITPTGTTFTLIHYVYLVDGDGGKDWRVACMPSMIEMHETQHHKHVIRTNDIRAATCPACKKTDAFKKARAAIEAISKRPINEK